MTSRAPKPKTDPQEMLGEFIQMIDIDSLLSQLALPLLDVEEDEALDRAKQLYYKACDAPTSQKQIFLAKKAIATSPLCADAFVLLAQHEEVASEAQLALYRKATDAGKKALGDSFEDLAGEFWGFIETRPYMRAKLGLATCLWQRNERGEALCHLREMLELNPNDNQGVRSLLAAYLLEERLHDELAALLKTYKNDCGADFGFSRALLAFRLHGDSAKSRKALSAAAGQNKYVCWYLTGKKKLPKTLPAYYSSGDDSEAILYAANFKKGWEETPGAIEWLRDFAHTDKTASSPAKRPARAKMTLAKV